MRWINIAEVIEDVMDVGFNSVLEDCSADSLSRQISQLYFYWNQPEKRKSVVEELNRKLAVKIPIQVDNLTSTQQEKQKVILLYTLYFRLQSP